MKSRYIKLTVPENLYREGILLVKEFGYSNIQDLTVESLRSRILDLRKQLVLMRIKRLQGSVKPGPRLTREEKEEIARKHTPERARWITKKYHLEDIKI